MENRLNAGSVSPEGRSSYEYQGSPAKSDVPMQTRIRFMPMPVSGLTRRSMIRSRPAGGSRKRFEHVECSNDEPSPRMVWYVFAGSSVITLPVEACLFSNDRGVPPVR